MPTEQQLLLIGLVAGMLAPFMVQLLKGGLGLSGGPAVVLTFVVAYVLGLVVALVTGAKLPSWNGDPVAFCTELAQVAGIAFALATVIYESWLKRLDGGVFANRKQ
ncbi:membrane hypothetical protein [Gammaproteobacteria bacterium]